MLNLPSILRKSKPGHDDDLKILRNWKEYTDDRKSMKYLMYELEMHEPGGNVVHFYKAIKLTRIIRLPKNAKQSEALCLCIRRCWRLCGNAISNCSP